MIKSVLLLFGFFATMALTNSAHAQYLKQKKSGNGPISKTIETGLLKMPTEKQLTKMLLKILGRKEHQEFISILLKEHPSKLPLETAYKWDLVRTRGWTTKQPYIRAYAMKGTEMSAVVALPVKVVNKKLEIDNSRDLHGCIPIECPVCILHFDTDSLLMGCSTYGVEDAYYKAHPKATCEHYLRKPMGQVLKKEAEYMQPQKKK